MNLFKETYAQFSLINLSDTDHLEEEWQKKYTVSNDIAHNWQEDEIEELLKKIDFNIKNFAKAVVRIAGISICIAGAAGKIASIVTINPILNAISIKGAAFGSLFTISPESAQKILSKLSADNKVDVIGQKEI